MKTILIVHDADFNDVDKMMRNIDYVAQTTPAFKEEFTLYCDANSPLVPILKKAGLPFSTDNFPEEPDYVISFIYDLHDGSEPSELAMSQWKSRRPVYAFQVVKSRG
ncbi:antirepressor protein [Escherichia phage PMBT57]|uniref:Antirepressor protein n=1 Tax=Escherichia phage PMBT57 TaxID=2079259 RepID=A0A2K9VA48_9CAUD|nr:antirepressor protein [Escherichia phage PMBT57]